MASPEIKMKDLTAAAAAAPPTVVYKLEKDQTKLSIADGEIEEGSMADSGLRDVLTKSELVFVWCGLLLMSTINYLNVSTLYTFSVYALSDFSRASAEGALNTALGVVGIAIQAPLAISMKYFHKFDVCLVIVALAVVGSVIEAATPSLAGYFVGFTLNLVGTMSARFLIFYLPAELSNARHRTLALNFAQFPMMVSLLAGPPITEAILDKLGWRWGYGIFAIVIPASNILLFAMLFVFRRRLVSQIRPATNSRATAFLKALRHIDITGLFLIIVGSALFLFPIPLESRGVDYYDTVSVITPTTIGAVTLIVFVIWELRFAKKPLFESRLLTNPSVLGCMATAICNYAAQQISVTYIYTWIIVASDYSISKASYLSLVSGITGPVFGVAVGAYVSWAKRGKWSLVICNAALILGTVLQYVFIDPKTQQSLVIFSQVAIGLGFVGSITALSIAQALGKKEDLPAVTALYLVLANLSGGVSSSLAGGLWTSLLLKYLKDVLPSSIIDQADDIMGSVDIATSFEWGTPERDAISLAYRKSFKVQMLAVLVAAILGLLISIPIKNVELEDESEN